VGTECAVVNRQPRKNGKENMQDRRRSYPFCWRNPDIPPAWGTTGSKKSTHVHHTLRSSMIGRALQHQQITPPPFAHTHKRLRKIFVRECTSRKCPERSVPRRGIGYSYVYLHGIEWSQCCVCRETNQPPPSILRPTGHPVKINSLQCRMLCTSACLRPL
jgi:hypothetical protein